MGLASCPKCKKLFQKVRANLCPSCESAEEQYYEVVREYIAKNPNQTAEAVSAATQVPIDVVLDFVNSGRIAVLGSTVVVCGRCGAPAIDSSKKLCQKCLYALNAEIIKQQSRVKLPERKEVAVGNAMNTFTDGK